MSDVQAEPSLRTRRRHGLKMATRAGAVLLPPLAIFLALVGAGVGWWTGFGAARGALYGPLFAAAAVLLGWILAITRILLNPAEVRLPDRP